jgi:hypothetical protein
MGQTPMSGVRIPDYLIEKIDGWRAREKDAPSRPEAIRRILATFLRDT